MINSSVFRFKRLLGDGLEVSCEEAITFPSDQPFKWLCARLVLSNAIPKFLEAEFSSALETFLEEEERKYYDEKMGELYEAVLPDDASANTIASFFRAAIDKRSSTRFQTEASTDEEIFGQAYTKIVQSPAAMDLIQLEHSFAVAVETDVIERNRVLHDFQQRILVESQALIDKGIGSASDLADAVSEMQRQFHIDYEVARTKWDSKISDLKELQRRDYRSFVMSIEEQMLHSSSPPRENTNSPTFQQRSFYPPPNNSGVHQMSKRGDQSNENNASKKSAPRSESFNVQLGRQLRTSYNLKLVQADPMDLMTTIGATKFSQSSRFSPTSESTVNLAERLGSALTIYSNELTGLIILVDRQALKSKDQIFLAEVCERSADFHFPDFDRQLAEIQETIDCFAAVKDADSIHADAVHNQRRREGQLPEPGDVYITRHTTLASAIGGMAGGGGGVGVVFHVVVGEEKEENRLRCLSPLYTALSAILRVCFQYDITTLAVPLLLTRRLTEQTTANWCYRRAEAVFKAVKGSLMELTTLRGQVLRNLLFLVPPQLPASASFDAFSHLLTASFQQLNPLIASSNA